MSLRLLVALSAALASACAGPERVVSIGDRIHHDDFDYAVTRVRRMHAIGSRTPSGEFWVVTFRVENHARRVAHEWSNATAYVTDARGRQFEHHTEAQRALASVERFNFADRYVTPAGETESTELVFDLPRDVEEPMLRVRGFLLMGDVLDLNAYARTKVRL